MWISATAPHARMLQGGAVERTLPEKIGNSRRPVGWRTWHESRELHILIRSFETFWNCGHLCPSVSYVDYVVLHWMFWLCEVNLCSVLRFDFVEVWPKHLGPFAPLTSFQYLLTSFNIKSIDFIWWLYIHILTVRWHSTKNDAFFSLATSFAAEVQCFKGLQNLVQTVQAPSAWHWSSVRDSCQGLKVRIRIHPDTVYHDISTST